MRSSHLHLPVLAAIFACTPTAPSDSATTGTSTTTATTSTAGASTSSATDPPTTTTATTPGTLTDPPTTTTPTTDDTTAGATSTTTGPDTTGATDPDTTTGPDTTGTTGTTGDPGLVEFAARYFPGGLDRIVVRKADFGPGLCTSIIFLWPGMPVPGVTVPDGWGLQSAQIGNNIDTCLDLNMPVLPNAVTADSVAGTAAWPAPGCPKALDIDLTLTFPQQFPWTPTMDVVQAVAIPIDGC